MAKKGDIPKASKEILSHPYVGYLHGVIEELLLKVENLTQEVSELKNEIATLKKVPKRPRIKPSSLDEEKKKAKKEKEVRPGSEKRKKKGNLPIDETRKIEATNIPKGWTLIGYKPYVVQDIIIHRNNIKYEREIWVSPDGNDRIVAELPASLQGRDFGEEVRRYVINLYNECHVTQPIIHNHLMNLGVDISAGNINFILNEDKANDRFEKELLEVVKTGIEASKEVRVDDTGARHKGKNGYCTCINTDLFTYFVSSPTKSRINFLSILQLTQKDYYLNETALLYLREHNLSPKYMNVLESHKGAIYESEEDLNRFLENSKLTAQQAVRIIKEGLMIGSLVERGFDPEKIIHSDGAPQFNLFLHALCWKHAERPFVKLRIHNEVQQQQWDKKREDFWQLYQDLKSYKEVSSLAQKRRKAKMEKRFDELCQPVENFAALNSFFEDLIKKKKEMLRVLEFPSTSLHNNATEKEIREYAKRRKISGSTRSDKGQKSRDVFTSLKKTCTKLGVNFWDYLMDRIKGENKIPPLVDILKSKAEVQFT